MLDPELLTNTFLSVLQAIPELASAMTVDNELRITANHYYLGSDQPLNNAIYEMPSPSMLLVYCGTKGGNFSGQCMWKHMFELYYRMANVANNQNPVGYEKLWWYTVNKIPTGFSRNIREVQIHPMLDIMDTPSIVHMLDQDYVDRFKATFVIPEIGDN